MNIVLFISCFNFLNIFDILIETVINLQDEEGFTPLMWAAAHGQIAVVEFLLQNVCKNELIVLLGSHRGVMYHSLTGCYSLL